MNLIEDMKTTKEYFKKESTMNEIEDIVNRIKKYDIYDIIARIAGLNLMSENQNKSILLDGFIATVLSKDKGEYNSKVKMSAGKFKKLIEELNRTELALAIDPNENAFIQNIMFEKDYKVFNGIDFSPAYNLQMLIDVLYYYENDLPKEYLKKASILILFILGISDEIVRKANIEFENIVSDEGRRIVLPNNDKVSQYAKIVRVSDWRIREYLESEFKIEDFVIKFGEYDAGNTDSRAFYNRPFLWDKDSGEIILLNIAILPTYVFNKVLSMAIDYEIKDKVLNRLNDYIWRECIIEFNKMGHRKIKEMELGISLENRNYYKEMLLNVFNNQLMLVIYVCDDGEEFKEMDMRGFYPNEYKHSQLFEERLRYYDKKIQEKGIDKKDIFCINIINSIGRGIFLAAEYNPFGYKILNLNPFELQCIRINESKNNNFLPRYIRAKERITEGLPNVFSELNAINMYVESNYSFYIADEFNPVKMDIYIDTSEGIKYLNKALSKSNIRIVDSYVDGWKTRVELSDKKRNIYREVSRMWEDRSTVAILYSNCVVWITSDKIVEYSDVNLYMSIMDTISFWLSECKNIIEKMNFKYRVFHFNVKLDGNRKKFYYKIDNNSSLLTDLKIFGSGAHYDMIWNHNAFAQMSVENNLKERELCEILLNILERQTLIKDDYIKEMDEVFSNLLKKKFFSLDYIKTPYLKPTNVISSRMIQIEDENDLLDKIGSFIIEERKWEYGEVPLDERTKVIGDIVTMLYTMLTKEIEILNPINLVEIIYNDLEDVLYKLMLASERFAFDCACYPEKQAQLINEYNKLNQVSIALKFLMEYVAAKPPKGNKLLGEGKYEYILAICSMIINWAYKKDLFTYDIIDSSINILKSGRIGIKRERFDEMNKYGLEYRQEKLYFESTREYRKKYEIDRTDYSDLLNEAFLSGYQYTFSQFCNVINEMICYDSNKGEIIVEDKEKVLEVIHDKNSELPLEIISKVIEDISLVEREEFLVLPSKYRREDVYPWRFNREYSFSRRPIIIRDNKMIWGNRQLYHMMLYVTDLIYDGKFRTKDRKMSKLIGKISDERGKNFNALIVDILNDMNEFRVYSNVKKINGHKIANTNGETYGDIDVLIIDDKEHHIYVAEVKDFSFSKNPYEIQAEFKRMFVDGKKKCFATKHNKRVEWVQSHLKDVQFEYGLEYDGWRIRGMFIVSEQLISNKVYSRDIDVISLPELTINRIRKGNKAKKVFS